MAIATVYCTTQFLAFHYWPEAPEQFSHLSSAHRHIFHVEVGVLVSHDNRDVEFQHLKTIVDLICKDFSAFNSTSRATTLSCEQFCDIIERKLRTVHGLRVRWVDVSEDKENGAYITYE